VSLAQDVKVQSRIDLAEFHSKTIKSSWCVFSDGYSSTDVNPLSVAWDATAGDELQPYTRNGKTYLARKITWESHADKKNFTLRFHADSARFSGEDTYDDRRCSYKTWRGRSVSGETTLKARAAFRIPRDVWAIRIQTQQVSPGALTTLALFNNDYIVSEQGGAVLSKQPLYTFKGSKTNQYALVNPSTHTFDNFVFLEYEYVKRTLTESDAEVAFTVDFIAAEECLGDLAGKTYSELLGIHVGAYRLDRVLKDVACMLNVDYVKHSLATIHIYDLEAFFGDLDHLQDKVEEVVARSADAASLENYEVLSKLLDRVRFYYAYEIVKEVLGLLKHEIQYDGETVDSLFYIEVLRARGVLYLFSILENLTNDLNAELRAATGPFVHLDKPSSKKMRVFVDTFLPYEHKSFRSAHALIYSPRYLALHSYSDFKAAAHRSAEAMERMLARGQVLLSGDEVTKAQITRLLEAFSDVSAELREYLRVFDSFNAAAFRDGAPLTPIEARKRLLVQLETVFRMNLRSLSTIVTEYFKRHFEDPAFHNIVVGSTTYRNVDDFIEEFETLLRTN